MLVFISFHLCADDDVCKNMNQSSKIVLQVFFLEGPHWISAFYWFCVSARVPGQRVCTWLMAGSGGQGRHDSCRLLPGSPQAVENGSRASEWWAPWRLSPGTSWICRQALCHEALQENKILEPTWKMAERPHARVCQSATVWCVWEGVCVIGSRNYP